MWWIIGVCLIYTTFLLGWNEMPEHTTHTHNDCGDFILQYYNLSRSNDLSPAAGGAV